jgi:MerR family transcriptional regulator, thiopeptide resistance regulator
VSAETTTWKVGELADAAGLTVRTLHHYDQIGLLCPSLRNAGGYRLYTSEDARRLYQIVALRGLGLQLGQIRDYLSTDVDPQPLIAEQVGALTAQIEAATRLRSRLISLLELLGQRGEPDGRDLLELIQQTADVGHLVTGYLSAEQIARLAHRHEALGEEAVRLVREELPQLYRQAMSQYQAGTDPSDATVAALVKRIDQASAILSGGDDAITAGVRRLWAERGEEVYPGSGIPWSDLVDFLDQARASAGKVLP